MRKVQMYGSEKIEVDFDGVVAGITITNNRTKNVAAFMVDEHKTLNPIKNLDSYKPNIKALHRALLIYDDMRSKVFALC